jgi:hypothetical protein
MPSARIDSRALVSRLTAVPRARCGGAGARSRRAATRPGHPGAA